MAKINIGGDPGFGAWKLYAHGAAIVAPSQVIRASSNTVNLGAFDMDKRKASGARAHLIESDGHAYWVGLGAYEKNLSGKPIEEYGVERLTTDSHMKMVFYSALSETKIIGKDDLNLWIGLPFKLASGDAAKSNIKAVKAWLMGQHNWRVDRAERAANVVSVKATSQAQGAYWDFRLNDAGQPVGEVAQDGLYGVLSIGFGTIEIGIVVNDLVQEGESVNAGIQSALQNMRGPGQSMSELDTKIRGGMVLNGSAADWVADVRGAIVQRWANVLPRMEKVICVGGGIRFMRNELRAMFGDKMWTPATPDDEVSAVARGLFKYAEAQ